ncbi:S9 family peptidase [Kangiella sp. TOML190]|uniref:S9 family peptidase n=1 Tax=Kangiella sp. TOML190 TaxID=2931351 RepID=UPI0020406A90|nr:S9 family peptidase [Kangiella sp. TOML190]
MKKEQAYGQWPSEISAEMLASKSTRLGQIQWLKGQPAWLESRPEEKGRGVIVAYQNGLKVDLTPEAYNVRTRLHEYGGGDFWTKDELIIFANDSDQRLYLQNNSDGSIEPITQAAPFERAWRYGDGDISPNKQFTVCVRERHQQGGTAFDVINELVLIDLAQKEGDANVQVIASGQDFYSNPRVAPDGNSICWLSWQHPNMPWDETELWLAEIDDNQQLSNPRKVAAGEQLSVYNPQWSPDGQLYYVADNNGWWHIYRHGEDKPLHEFVEIEFGFPQWVFGCNSFQFIDKDTILAIGTKQAHQALYQLDLTSGQLRKVSDQWNAFNGQLMVKDKQACFIAANAKQAQSLIKLDLSSMQTNDLLGKNDKLSLSTIARAEHVTFATSDNQLAHGFFYAPLNDKYECSTGLPPLIVMSHGGPTGMTDSGFDLQIQYWTSRGFAVADVNYRGSTGYGRAYRDSLKGNWGVYDVDDCIAMADYLAQQGLVDGKRLAIRGGSAGGFTTLCALTFHDRFQVGMSRYGVADLLSLAKDSHKFEIRYLDSVVGPLPEAKQIYLERSPSEHTERLSCPILILQGLEDKVVPPSQSEAMVTALKANGLDYQYIEFAGEGHGFRKPETIIQAFEAELDFYRKYLL